MNYRTFYSKLFCPIERNIGPIDRDTIVSVIGFDLGGPLNFCTVGAKKNQNIITYVSCELAVRKEQIPSSKGRFELLCHCDDETWVRSVLSTIGRMSLEAQFDHLHTVDISPIVGKAANLQGIVLERFASTKIEGEKFSLLRVHGISRRELEFAMEKGSDTLFTHLTSLDIFPNTLTTRQSSI